MPINLTELFSCQGKEKSYTQDLEMELFHGPNGTYAVAEKGPVTLTITHTGDKKLEIRGEVSLALTMPCDRCLDPVKVPFHLSIEEELDMNQSNEERVEALDEQPYVSGYILDVDQLVAAELMASLPMKVLCKEDCRGLCRACGKNRNEGPCGCDDSVPDPRMAAIRDIFKQFKEV